MPADYLFRDVLTRNQLAQFLKSPETIRAFENLARDVGEILPANEAEIRRTANLALALAAQALLLQPEYEDPAIVPGPKGADGQDGRLLVLFEDGTPGEDGAPAARGGAVSVTGSRASGAALVSLLSALARQGLIFDNTTA